MKQKKSEKRFIILKWKPNTNICSLHHFIFGENLKKKNTFPKEFFNEMWLIVGDYKYFYITEIKIGNLYSCGILHMFQGQNIFPNLEMLIYAN